MLNNVFCKIKILSEMLDLNDFFCFLLSCFSSLFIYSYRGDQPLASNLQVDYALPVNKEFSVAVGKYYICHITKLKIFRLDYNNRKDAVQSHLRMCTMEPSY